MPVEFAKFVRGFNDVGLSRRRVLHGAGALMAAAGLPFAGSFARAQERPPAPAQPAGTPHSLAELHQPDQTLAVSMSPDGRRLAVLRQVINGEQRRAILDIVQAADPGGARTRVPIGEVEAQAMEWADDTHVLMTVIAESELEGSRPMNSFINRASQTVRARRVLSVNADTGRGVAMFAQERQKLLYNLDLGRVIDIRADRPGYILMAARDYNLLQELYRVSLATGVSELVERGDTRTWDWRAVDGVPVLRRDFNQRGDVQSWYARAPGERDWKFIRADKILEQPNFVFAGPSETPGAIRVLARAEGEDVQALRDMDLATLRLGPPIRARQGFDALQEVLDADRKPVATGFLVDRREYDFADASLGPHYRAMNRFFDNEASVSIVDVDAAHDRILTVVDGPREPGAWYLYDRPARSFTNISARTGLDAARLGPMKRLEVRTRDGAVIGAYLTAPPDGRKGPLVVLVHGGPAVRDAWSWDRQAQALTSRGFWVVQPNYRGSGGFGEAFEDLGDRQWGARVQQDIEDAALAAVADAGLDSSKVAIMGSSFGGYSALISAALRPDFYRAAISICGFSDIADLLAEVRREDDSPGNQVYAREVVRLGDPRADAAEQAAYSPRGRAAEITCPVFMAHGVDDPICPIAHSRAMRTALDRAGKRVQLVEIEDAGHADWDETVELDLMTRYVTFLRSALG